MKNIYNIYMTKCQRDIKSILIIGVVIKKYEESGVEDKDKMWLSIGQLLPDAKLMLSQFRKALSGRFMRGYGKKSHIL